MPFGDAAHTLKQRQQRRDHSGSTTPSVSLLSWTGCLSKQHCPLHIGSTRKVGAGSVPDRGEAFSLPFSPWGPPLATPPSGLHPDVESSFTCGFDYSSRHPIGGKNVVSQKFQARSERQMHISCSSIPASCWGPGECSMSSSNSPKTIPDWHKAFLRREILEL